MMDLLVCFVKDLVQYFAHDKDVEVAIDRHRLALRSEMVFEVDVHETNGLNFVLKLLIVFDTRLNISVNDARFCTNTFVDHLYVFQEDYVRF